jgi:hypothetical protein
LNAQLGYMNLFQQLPTGNRFNNNHTIRLFFFNNINLRKNPEAVDYFSLLWIIISFVAMYRFKIGMIT